jgi:hypothetical protein
MLYDIMLSKGASIVDAVVAMVVVERNRFSSVFASSRSLGVMMQALHAATYVQNSLLLGAGGGGAAGCCHSRPPISIVTSPNGVESRESSSRRDP